MIGFKFKHLKELKDEQYKHFIWRTNKLIMKILINSNTSLDCLHSKDVVLHVRPDLLENMLQCQLCQLLRWYGKVLPNLVITFPKLDSWQRPQLYVTPGHQELKVSILHWHHNLTSVSADSRPIEPSHFLSSLQSSPNFLLVAHHYPSDWMNWFLTLGSQFPKGWQPQLHKSLKKGSFQ